MQLMFANTFKDQNPVGWWLSEKHDGVRFTWTGTELLSKEDNSFNAPAWFVEGLPKSVRLDGEMGAGRGQFQKVLSVIQSSQGDWSAITLMVFDVVNELPCEERTQSLYELDLPQHCEIVTQTLCQSIEHYNSVKAEILNQGGEGVMLRQAQSFYEHGRSNALLKDKPINTEEARVISHKPGTGRNAGKMGALVCEFNSIVFNLGVGFSSVDRKYPPRIDAQITFSCIGFTKSGKPRHASYIAIRDYE